MIKYYKCRECKKQLRWDMHTKTNKLSDYPYYVRERVWRTISDVRELKEIGCFGKEWECRACWKSKNEKVVYDLLDIESLSTYKILGLIVD